MSDGSTRDFLGCNGCVIRVIPLFPGMRFHECSMFLVVSGLKFETPPAVKCEAFPAEKIRRVHSQNRRAFEVVLSTYVDGLPGGFLLFSGRNPNQTMAPWGS